MAMFGEFDSPTPSSGSPKLAQELQLTLSVPTSPRAGRVGKLYYSIYTQTKKVKNDSLPFFHIPKDFHKDFQKDLLQKDLLQVGLK